MNVDLALQHFQVQWWTIGAAEDMFSSGSVTSSEGPPETKSERCLIKGAAHLPARAELINQLLFGPSVGLSQFDLLIQHTPLKKLGFHGDLTSLPTRKSPPGEILCPKNNYINIVLSPL